jgi:hypothetical protein
MKTGEDVVKEGLYASRCCGHEQTFNRQGTFQRCPACSCLCEWELEDVVVLHKKTNQEAA